MNNYSNDTIQQHASGKAVMLKQPIPGLMRLKPSIVLAYQSNKDVVVLDRNYIYSRPILPMPVAKSPFMIYGAWTTKYTDSLSILFRLRSIQQCFYHNPLKGKEEEFNMIYKQFQMDMSALEDKLFDVELPHFYKHNPSSTEEACTLLIGILEKHTFDVIHLFEKSIHAMFIPEYPLQNMLTPVDAPDLQVLIPEEQKHVLHAYDMFFKNKQIIQNVRLEYEGHEKHYCFKDIIGTGPKYNNYLDQQRAIEYYHFLNIKQ